MKSSYELQICVNSSKHVLINNILGVDCTHSSSVKWVLEVIEKSDKEYYDFINSFLDLLEGKYSELNDLGVNRDDITIWYFYIHDGQCNMEFAPREMKRLGDNQIGLCISCYEDYKE